MINHVTYHLTPDGLATVDQVMKLLGFTEVEPDDPFEHGYSVRWFHPLHRLPPWVHFVSDGTTPGDQLALGHFCVIVPRERFKKARKSDWLHRDSGSGRIWLLHDNVRIEVRPS